MKNRFVLSGPGAALVSAGALAAAVGVGLRAAPAHACGGFFCSQAAPVEQAAEEIIFIDNPDDTVTAVIRIQYQGPSDQFAWVLPISGAPEEVAVSSNVAFDSLRTFTDPRYVLNTTVEGMCKVDNFGFGNTVGTPTQGAATPGAAAEDGGVGVVAQGSVGPYDWTVINVDEQLPDPADAAVEWLVENGYDVTDLGPDVLRPYLAEGLNLMAFKLQKSPDVTAGSIRPVVITYESELPAIPIRPTAVAAQNDMGILVWVLGDSQAIPANYKSLVVNEALINWFNYRANYRQVVTEAANQAGGQGFVTEMAGDTGQLDQAVFSLGMEQQWQQYSLQQFVDGFDMIQQASWQYRGWDGWRDAVCGAVTPPDNVTCDEFGRNPDAYRGTAVIDQDKFMRGLYEDVVRPVIRTQELLLSRPYFTRLFSTMSADEMTVDPAFDFNSDLAAVSNLHTAEQVIECSPDVNTFEAPWRIELPQGGVIRGKGQQGVWPLAIDDLPANLKVVQLGTRGAGQIVEDNSRLVADSLFERSGMVDTGMARPDPPTDGVPIGGLPADDDDDDEPAAPGAGDDAGLTGDVDGNDPGVETASASDGCSAAGSSRGGASLLLMLGAALSLRARRRRR